MHLGSDLYNGGLSLLSMEDSHGGLFSIFVISKDFFQSDQNWSEILESKTVWTNEIARLEIIS